MICSSNRLVADDGDGTFARGLEEVGASPVVPADGSAGAAGLVAADAVAASHSSIVPALGSGR